MRILVIDDDKDIRDVLSLVLASEGHEVETAADGVAGLDQLRGRGRPELILLDMMMPRLDGEGFLRAKGSSPNMADIPVVILTGHPVNQVQATRLGAVGFLTKPVELFQLLRTIHQAKPHPDPLA